MLIRCAQFLHNSRKNKWDSMERGEKSRKSFLENSVITEVAMQSVRYRYKASWHHVMAITRSSCQCATSTYFLFNGYVPSILRIVFPLRLAPSLTSLKNSASHFLANWNLILDFSIAMWINFPWKCVVTGMLIAISALKDETSRIDTH